MKDELKGKVIRSHWRKDTLREIYHDGDVILKHYVVKPGTKRFPKPWAREDAALKALEGSGFPESHGYSAAKNAHGLDILFKRDYFEGSPIENLTPEDVSKMAGELAAIHKHGVITHDAKIDNFIKNERGDITFLDFGAAVVFKRKTPLYYTAIGREMMKFLRLTLFWDPSLWKVFAARYKAAHPMPVIARFLVKTGFFFSLNFRRIRKMSLRPK